MQDTGAPRGHRIEAYSLPAGPSRLAACGSPAPTALSASTPLQILGAPITLSPSLRSLKKKILAAIQNKPGIDTYDIAVLLNRDSGTIGMLCLELQKEGKIAGVQEQAARI